MSYQAYSCLPDAPKPNSVALIDTEALANNYRALATLAKARAARPIAVVKADAYGHGIPICVPTLLRQGCDFFAVASLAEAIATRTAAQQQGAHPDILIFGYTDPADTALLLQHDLIQSVLSEEHGHALATAAKALGVTPRVHLAADTGMNRVGFCTHSEELLRNTVLAIEGLQKSGTLLIEGLFSHLARADEPDEEIALASTKRQVARFATLVESLEQKGIRPAVCHLCNSAGLVTCPEAAFDAVRLGIALYGCAPVKGMPPLAPVMRLETRAVHLHQLLPGECVGYGGEFSAASPRTVATLPIGYADGFLRAYRNATVSIYTATGHHRVPVVGRVCMDQCMLDVTDTAAAVGDRVVLFGEEVGDTERLARIGNTIPYEVMTSISARIPRQVPKKRQ